VEIALEPADVSMGQPAIIHGWLVVTGTMECILTFSIQVGMECHHPN
jgi:hypothetical protein